MTTDKSGNAVIGKCCGAVAFTYAACIIKRNLCAHWQMHESEYYTYITLLPAAIPSFSSGKTAPPSIRRNAFSLPALPQQAVAWESRLCRVTRPLKPVLSGPKMKKKAASLT